MIKFNMTYVLLLLSSAIFAYFEGGNLPYMIFYSFLIPFILSCIFIYINNKRLNIKIRSLKDNFQRMESGEISYVFKNQVIIPIPYLYYTLEFLKNIDKNYRGKLININIDKSVGDINKIKFMKRGKYNIGEISLEFRDFFNIIRYSKKINKKKIIHVYPKVYNFMGFQSSGIDKYTGSFDLDNKNLDIHKYKDIKKYEQGESLKKIHWKISAKKGELYSKSNDFISSSHMVLILDMNETNNHRGEDGNLEEEIISFFLSAIRYFVLRGIKIHALINNYEIEDRLIKNLDDFQHLLLYFLENRSEGKKNISEFITEKSCLYSERDISIFTLDLGRDYGKELIEYTKKLKIFYLEEGVFLSDIRRLQKDFIRCYSSKILLKKE